MGNLNTAANLTISYNEVAQSFVSKHTYKPVLMFSDAFNFLSTDLNGDDIYVQNRGEYGDFFGIKESSDITLILNDMPEAVKNFYHIEYKLETTNLSGANVENINFDKYTIWTEHQTTGEILLATDARRTTQRLRKWRTRCARDLNSSRELSRMCNEYAFLKLEYNNDVVGSDYLQFKLYPCMYSYQPSIY